MKKIIILILLFFLALPAFSQQVDETLTPMLQCGVEFDWISKTQLQRDENIKQIQDILFQNKNFSQYSKKQFKEEYSQYWKNPNYINDYEAVSHGKTEDADKYYAAFYYRNIFVAYGIQYKNNLKNKFYYDAFGGLRWVDVFSPNYPKYPYWSYQYYKNGKLVNAYYYVSADDQYVFDEHKKFVGRWYKYNLYNRNAKIILTRSNY